MAIQLTTRTLSIMKTPAYSAFEANRLAGRPQPIALTQRTLGIMKTPAYSAFEANRLAGRSQPGSPPLALAGSAAVAVVKAGSPFDVLSGVISPLSPVGGLLGMTQPTSVQPGSAPSTDLVYGTPTALGIGAGSIATILAKIKALGLLGKLPGWAVAALGVAGTAAAIWGIWESLKAAGIVSSADEGSNGGGGGDGVDSRNAVGTRDGSYLLSGPGVPEPAAGTYYKTWRTAHERQGSILNGYTWYWALNDGRIVCYTDTTGRARVWRPKKPAAVLMRGGKTSLSQAIKAQRLLDKMWRTVAKRTKQLKLA